MVPVHYYYARLYWYCILISKARLVDNFSDALILQVHLSSLESVDVNKLKNAPRRKVVPIKTLNNMRQGTLAR